MYVHGETKWCRPQLVGLHNVRWSKNYQERIDGLESSLTLFKRSRKAFLTRYMTMDDACIHHHTPNWQLAAESRHNVQNEQRNK